MPRNITIHKPTHKFFGPKGSPAIAIAQVRGDFIYLNRFDDAGNLVEKTWAVGSCGFGLTNYGYGFEPDNAEAVERMRGAWSFTFGADVPFPLRCERIINRI